MINRMKAKKVRTCVLNIPLNEGQGHPHDSSGFGNNGTNHNASWASGDYGWAMDFDSNDYIACGNDISLQELGTFTVSVWFKIRDLENSHTIVSKGKGLASPGNRGWAVSFYGAGKRIYFDTYESDGTRHYNILYNVNTTNWYRYVASFEHGKTTTMINDGTPVIKDTDTYDIGNPGYHFRISEYGGWLPFDGLICNVKFHNRVLPTAESLADFNAEKARFGL